MVYQLGDVSTGSVKGDVLFKPLQKEPVVPCTNLSRDFCGLGHLIQGADHVALATRHVDRGCDHPPYRSSSDEFPADYLAVCEGGRLDDVSREVELISYFCHLCEGVCEVPLRGPGYLRPPVPLPDPVHLGFLKGLQPPTVCVTVVPVDDG